MTLPPVAISEPGTQKQRSVLNAFFAARGTEILGFREDGTTIYLRFRAAPLVPKVRVHVQSTAAGEGGLAAYDSANFFSSTLVDCRAARVQDVTITPLTVGERYVVFLVPVQEDGAGLAVLFDGEGGRPDDLSFIGEQRATLPAAHVLATTAALGSEHTVSGLTARQVLIATAATTALFRALTAADVAGASDAERTFASSSLYTFPGPLTVAGLLTAQQGLTVSGGSVITATGDANSLIRHIYKNVSTGTSAEISAQWTLGTAEDYYFGIYAGGGSAGYVYYDNRTAYDVVFQDEGVEVLRLTKTTRVAAFTGGLSVTGGILQTGTVAARFANTFASVPAGSVGVAVEIGVNGGQPYIVAFDRTAGAYTQFQLDGATHSFMISGSTRWSLTTAGHWVTAADNTYDIGALGATRPRNLYIAGAGTFGGAVSMGALTATAANLTGDLNHDGSNIGFFATAPTTKQTVTGARGGNAALGSLLTALAAYGLVTDSSSA